MSTSLTINGVSYDYPEDGDTSGWGPDATNWATAVSSSLLQKTGGNFTLTATVDFGSDYGIKALAFESVTANAATAGEIRLANADTIAYRNNANTANLDLGPGTDDLLEFNGVDLVNISATQTLTNKTISAASNTFTGLVTLTGTDTLTNKTLTTPVINSPTGIVKGDVGLGNVDNTSDATKNAAAATLTNKTMIDESNNVHANAMHLVVRNDSGGTLLKGSPVSATGFNTGQDLITVGPSDANTASTNPCIGLMFTDLANNATCRCIVSGEITDIDTSAWAVGDALYVSETAGTLTTTRPTAVDSYVQAVAKVTKSHLSAGRILVVGAGRANDFPNATGDLHVIVTATGSGQHGLEIELDAAGYGDVNALEISFETGTQVTGEDHAVIGINLDALAATGGDVFGLAMTGLSGGASMFGLQTGPNVGPIHQDSGSFLNPTTATNNTPSTDVSTMLDGSTGTTTNIFPGDNDYIIIGAAAEFQKLSFVLQTESSNGGITPTFWYSTIGTGQFTQFVPVDGTDGMQHTGTISWDTADLVGHVADDVTGTFDIKIIRTRNNIITPPVLYYAKTAAVLEFIWNADGDVSIKDLDAAGNVSIDGTLYAGSYTTIGVSTDSTYGELVVDGGANDGFGSNLIFQRGGVNKFWVGTKSTIIGGNTDDGVMYAGAGNAVELWSGGALTAKLDASQNVTLSGSLTAKGDVLVTGGTNFFVDGEPDPRNAFYRGGTDFQILRNYNQVYTVQQIWSPPGAIGVTEREATLALVRGDEPDQEYIDLYNNGYTAETQFGIRIQKRGTGAYRDFVFDQYDGTTKTPILVLGADTNATFAGNVSIGGNSVVAGTSIVGTSADSTYGELVVDGGANSGFGSNLIFQRGGVNKFWVGTKSAILGGAVDAGVIYAPAGDAVEIHSGATLAATFDSSQNLVLANDLAISEGGTGASTASAARIALGLDQFDLQFELQTGEDATFTLHQHAQFGYTINKAYLKTDSGTITVEVQIEGTVITGLSALAVTSTESNSTATAAQTVAIGNTVTLVTSANVSAVNTSITLLCTRS